MGRLQEECKKYNENYVFKKCGDCIVILYKPKDGFISNENRSEVIDKNFAKFRANRFFVKDIINYTTLQHLSVIYHQWEGTGIIYKVGTIIEPDDFDFMLNYICSHGIHYYLTLEAAFYHEMELPKYGQWKCFTENGRLIYDQYYKNNKLDGFQVKMIYGEYEFALYNKGKKHGLCKLINKLGVEESFYYYGTKIW